MHTHLAGIYYGKKRLFGKKAYFLHFWLIGKVPLIIESLLCHKKNVRAL